jgi:hypothetical protein
VVMAKTEMMALSCSAFSLYAARQWPTILNPL